MTYVLLSVRYIPVSNYLPLYFRDVCMRHILQYLKVYCRPHLNLFGGKVSLLLS